LILDSSPATERRLLVMGAVSGFLAVALGAFGAHSLRAALPPDRLEVFETGARYQMYHAFALIAAGLLTARRRGRAAPAAGWLFAAGTIVFCGSLYALAASGISAWGAITPVGGLAWLAGWILLAASASRPRTVIWEIEPPQRVVVEAPLEE
jgi:uncharacterized membrane protein YgdD (TMEM256/DUF423 family)